jgi:hypothetical protein
MGPVESFRKFSGRSDALRLCVEARTEKLPTQKLGIIDRVFDEKSA